MPKNPDADGKRYAGSYLTVIIRDDAPLIFVGDSPAYRRVTIGLTHDQVKQLELKKTGTDGKTKIFESVSQCFLEYQN
jgi:hypothetical protein